MKCPICNAETQLSYEYNPTTMHKLIDFDTNNIIFCEKCIFGFNPPFKKEDLALYYENYYSGKLHKHLIKRNFKLEEDYTVFSQDMRSLSQISLISNYINFNLNLNILEIGSSTNNFICSLFHANNKSEFFSSDYKTLNNKSYIKNVGLISDKVAHNYQEKFDLIVMSHTLEHFQGLEIIESIGTIKKMLKKNGLFFIEVPNADIKKFIHERIVPHTSFFSIESFQKISKKMMFETIFLNTCGNVQMSNNDYQNLENLNMKENKYTFIKSKNHNNILLNVKIIEREKNPIEVKKIIRNLLINYLPFYNKIKLTYQRLVFKNTLTTYVNNKNFVYGGNREYIRVILKK